MRRLAILLALLLVACDGDGAADGGRLDGGGSDAGGTDGGARVDGGDGDAGPALDAGPDAGPAPEGHSIRFFGNGGLYDDRVRIPIDDPATNAPGPPVDVGADDFTIDFWVRSMPGDNPNAAACGPGIGWTSSNIIIDRDRHSQPPTFGVGIGDGAMLFAVLGPSDDSLTLCGTATVTDGAWHHAAVQRRRSDGHMWIWVDGALDAEADGPDGDVSYPDDGTPLDVCPGGLCDYSDPYLVFGAEKHGYESISYDGWLDEVRVSDVLRFTAPFAVPTAPPPVDGDTVALYRFDEGPGAAMTADATGRSPAGEVRYGGSPRGPELSTDTPF